MERKVQISGRAAYRPHARFPHRVVVKALEVLDADGPSFLDFGGKATGAEDALKKLRELRDEWS
jgi:hypothetical protein